MLPGCTALGSGSLNYVRISGGETSGRLYVKENGVQTHFRRILSKYRVKDVKSMPVVIKDISSVYDAIVTLFTEDIGTIYVNDEEGYLAGVVSRKDMLKTTLGQVDIHEVPVNVIMTRMPNVITTTPDETIIDVIKR